jgi:hypothetical protein
MTSELYEKGVKDFVTTSPKSMAMGVGGQIVASFTRIISFTKKMKLIQIFL